jgi:hypothetical protein
VLGLLKLNKSKGGVIWKNMRYMSQSGDSDDWYRLTSIREKRNTQPSKS